MTGTGWNQLEGKNQKTRKRALLHLLVVNTLIFLASTGFASVVQAQNPRGSATGPTTANGYDHPGQYPYV